MTTKNEVLGMEILFRFAEKRNGTVRHCPFCGVHIQFGHCYNTTEKLDKYYHLWNDYRIAIPCCDCSKILKDLALKQRFLSYKTLREIARGYQFG
jgi:hypothetical protein